jgi:hypothetical protein
MFRAILMCGVLLACAALAAAEDRTGPEKKSAGPSARELLARVRQPITLDKGVDPNTPLKDALEFLADKFEVPILIDAMAFRDMGIQELETAPVRLPIVRNISMAKVLRKLLGQVLATYTVHDGYLGVVPLPTVPGADGTLQVDRSVLPSVYAIFEKRPLNEALQELSDLTDITVVLDTNRAAEKVKAPVTATFKNVGVDTAVRLLADMAELQMVRMDNVLYVTTAENAARVQPAREERKPAKAPAKATGM